MNYDDQQKRVRRRIRECLEEYKIGAWGRTADAYAGRTVR